jgi:hypothetical protein
MYKVKLFCSSLAVLLGLWAALLAATPSYAHNNNKVMGEVQFIPASQAEKYCGIWVDGEYVGYLEELKGHRKIELLPGEHAIVAREAGYQEFSKRLLIEPGQTQAITISLMKNPNDRVPRVTAEVKLDIAPSRAAVFMDNRYLGPVNQFGGARHALLVSAGKHKFKIAQPGYRTFVTEVNLLPNQKFVLKTDLLKGSITQAGPLIKKQ